jgi:nucleoside-diphosphate-sugar epimerase
MQIRNSALQYATESVVVRLFNTYGPGEYYSPYRSVNCRFLYCALHGLPWTVFRGHSRTSTYLADTVRTVANISDSFKPGETYNIGGTDLHSIEEFNRRHQGHRRKPIISALRGFRNPYYKAQTRRYFQIAARPGPQKHV